MVQRTHRSKVAKVLDELGEGRALVASEKERDGIRFRAVLAAYERDPDGYRFDAETMTALGVDEGDEIGILPLSGADIEDFHKVDVDEGEWTKL